MKRILCCSDEKDYMEIEEMSGQLYLEIKEKQRYTSIEMNKEKVIRLISILNKYLDGDNI